MVALHDEIESMAKHKSFAGALEGEIESFPMRRGCQKTDSNAGWMFIANNPDFCKKENHCLKKRCFLVIAMFVAFCVGNMLANHEASKDSRPNAEGEMLTTGGNGVVTKNPDAFRPIPALADLGPEILVKLGAVVGTGGVGVTFEVSQVEKSNNPASGSTTPVINTTVDTSSTGDYVVLSTSEGPKSSNFIYTDEPFCGDSGSVFVPDPTTTASTASKFLDTPARDFYRTLSSYF